MVVRNKAGYADICLYFFLITVRAGTTRQVIMHHLSAKLEALRCGCSNIQKALALQDIVNGV